MRSSDSARGDDSVARVALRLVVFCVPLALAWLGLEWGMKRVPNSYSMKRAGLEALSAEVDTVIVGSSNAYFGISPALLSGSAFNLANVSQSLYYDDLLLTQLAPRLPKLKRVLVPISYISLSFQLYDSVEYWRQYYYQHVWGMRPPREEDRTNVRMWSLVALYSPRLSLNAARKGFKASLAPEVDGRGWYPVPAEHFPADLSDEAARVPLARHHGMMHAKNEPANVASLEHLLSLLRQRNVEVVLVTLPVWRSYADGMKPEVWARTQATLERLTQKYGARYLSFLREPRLEAEDFHDPDHLNARGAVRFTQMLNVVLESSGQVAVPPRGDGAVSHSSPDAR